MTREEAIQLTAERWRAFLRSDPRKIVIGQETCVLCAYDREVGQGDCKRCPKFDRTGKANCEGSPHAAAYYAIQFWAENPLSPLAQALASTAILAEIAFIEDLSETASMCQFKQLDIKD
ncbi:hypothetical protein ACQU0X_28760 [Pseudovibrio ascidiaceicola]|uniref:hypothetical protein n=1 Tax=Pseudovibrio ascidiaceicola TaxID=285279 RepID=UPI003D36DDDC